FLKVFHANPLPMSITSLPDGKYLDVNKEFERVSGWSAKEAIGRTTADLNMWVYPEDFPLLSGRLAKENSARGVELSLRTRAGEVLTMLWSAEVTALGGRRCIITSAYDITDRKSMENDLRESEEKFRTVIEQNLEGIALIDEKGIIIEWNQALACITGVDTSTAIGKTLWDLQETMRLPDHRTPEWLERDKAAILNALRHADSSFLGKLIEAVIYRPDGTPVNIQQIIFPIKTTIGIRLGSLTRDITVQKASQKALKQSEELYRALIETTGTGYVVIDDSGRVLDANMEYVRLAGHGDLKDIRGRTVFDWTASYHKEKNRRAVKQCAQDGSIRNFEVDYIDKNGKITPIEINATVAKIDGAQRILTLCRDITERKRSEQSLRASEERYRLLHEYAPVGILLVNRSGQILQVNSAVLQILGSPSAEATKAVNFLTFPLLLKAGISAAFQRCIETGQVVLGEYPYTTKWGKSLQMLLRLVPIFDDHHQVNLVHVIAEDITERNKMIAGLQNAEKLESLGILAGGIAHDFNNLLTGIFGFIDVARLYNTSGAADKVSVNLTKALDVFNRARALTQQLLTFSKGGLPVKKVLALPQLLTNTTNFVLSGSMVGARFTFSEDLWPCEVDENQIGQVIDNIVINARQAMPTGGALVITAENMPQGSQVPAPLVPGDYVKISIRDSGTGISKEHLSRIFDPFFTTKQEGSGLGLATAYSIIRKHEGIIEAESELGTGATFHIYLPALPSAVTDTPSAGTKKHRGEGAVLVMDDEDFVRDVAVELLKTMGYSVDTAASGAEAIEKYRAARASPSPYRFCILDLTVPNGMGGKDAVQELLIIDPSVIAVAASGYSQDPVITDPQAFGFRDKIRKPFTKEELGEVLERVTGGVIS
ncbi:MAG TPA: PAS domain S-box protein, partial [Chitinivibrionales bacterium]|nr:PAS domain S-box protein [Chitinivibrionales bacterium]